MLKTKSSANTGQVFHRIAGWALLGAASIGVSSHAQVNQPPPSSPPPSVSLNALDEIKETKNQVSVSGDFMAGYGDLALPFRYGLISSPGTGVRGENVLGERDSTYYGGGISYSRGQSWFFDISFSQGSSTAEIPTLDLIPGNQATRLNKFEYSHDDTWLQLYARYAFPQLRGKRLNAYLRMGATVVDANLDSGAPQPLVDPTSSYSIEAETRDYTGNVGFGMSFSAVTTTHFRLSAVLEGEGFAGVRQQTVTETVSGAAASFGTTDIDDSLIYGGLGRSTIRLEFFPSVSSRFTFFADGGMQVRHSWTTYKEIATTGIQGADENTVGELLWGPYGRGGIRFSF